MIRTLAAAALAALSLAVPATAVAAGGPDPGPADPSPYLTTTYVQGCTGVVGRAQMVVTNSSSQPMEAQFIIDSTARIATLAPHSTTRLTFGGLRHGPHVAALWVQGWSIFYREMTVGCTVGRHAWSGLR